MKARLAALTATVLATAVLLGTPADLAAAASVTPPPHHCVEVRGVIVCQPVGGTIVYVP